MNVEVDLLRRINEAVESIEEFKISDQEIKEVLEKTYQPWRAAMAEQTRAQLTHRMEARRAEANADEELVRDLQIGINAIEKLQGEVAERAQARQAESNEIKRQIDKLR